VRNTNLVESWRHLSLECVVTLAETGLYIWSEKTVNISLLGFSIQTFVTQKSFSTFLLDKNTCRTGFVSLADMEILYTHTIMDKFLCTHYLVFIIYIIYHSAI